MTPSTVVDGQVKIGCIYFSTICNCNIDKRILASLECFRIDIKVFNHEVWRSHVKGQSVCIVSFVYFIYFPSPVIWLRVHYYGYVMVTYVLHLNLPWLLQYRISRFRIHCFVPVTGTETNACSSYFMLFVYLVEIEADIHGATLIRIVYYVKGGIQGHVIVKVQPYFTIRIRSDGFIIHRKGQIRDEEIT